LNRRTEFRVLSKDFVPKPKNIALKRSVDIVINPDDNVLDFTTMPKTGLITAPCILNGYTVNFVFDSRLRPQMSVEQALDLLSKGAITKDDFQGDPEEILADGTVANRAIVVIAEFTVANETIYDVEVMVNSNLAYPLVIGNSVLSELGDYTIDNENQKIIFKKNN
jgi:hypothetical protein